MNYQNINLLSEKEQIEIIINDDPLAIQHIKNPSLKVQLAAVNKNSYSIQYIKNPYLEVQLIAVNKDGVYIQYIKNPSYEIQLAAIQEKTNIYKRHFKLIKEYITYPDLLELIELKILTV